MKKVIEKNRILPPLFFFISGILLSDFVENQWLIIVIISPLVGVLSLFGASFLKALIFLPLGLLFISQNTIDENSILKFKDKKLDVEGIISQSVERSSNYTRFILDVDKVMIDNEFRHTKGKIIIYSEDNLFGLYRGYRIRVLNTKLQDFRVYKNPGNFDIRKYYQRKGIYLKGYLNNENDLISLGKSRGTNPLLVYIDKLRDNFGIYIRNNLSFPSSEIFTALTTGDQKGIPAEIRESFSSLGIAHIISISGLHVGAVALIFYFLIDWLLKRSEYMLLKYNVPRLTASVLILPVFIYMIVAGLAAPVVRATIMIAVYLLSIVAGRPHNKLNTLGVAAFLILIIEPSAIYDLSFQLSFISVAGILIVNQISPFSFSSFRNKVVSSLKCTTAATLFTAPLIINTFGTLPLVSVPANLLIIPIVEFIIVPVCLLSFLGFNIHAAISDVLIPFNGYLIDLLIYCADYLSGLSFSDLTVAYLNKISFIFIYITVLLIVLSKIRKILVWLAICLLFIIIITTTKDARETDPVIEFPDTGKREFVLVRLPGGKKILLNATASSSYKSEFIERSVLTNYLLHSGISKIDYIILLSNDNYLMNGSMFLINKFDVDYLLTKDSKLSSDIWEKIYEGDIQKTDLLSESEPLLIDNTKFNFYFIDDVYSGNKTTVIKISHNDHRIIIGDLSGIDLEHVARIYNNHEFKGADVIYITRANNSDRIATLVNYLKPKKLVTGKFNERTVAELIALHPDINIYETGEDGLVSVIMNQNISIKTDYR